MGVPTLAQADAPIDRVTITPSARVASLVEQMTLDEKLTFVTPMKDPLNPGAVTSGSAAYIPGVSRLGIPEMRYTDGTGGLRLPVPATAYPVPTMLGSTFNTDLAYTYGNTLATEARAANQDVLLAPMVTIIREPEGGRNYEAYSEDPLVVAQIGGNQVKGIQDAGVIATLKHLAMNDQETNKSNLSVEVDDQALHEVHLAGFQAGIDAGAGAAMCAYNKVNGVYSCSNDTIMNRILKTELNFQGYIMSDWGVTKGVTDMNAGLDQEMHWVGMQQAKLTTALRTALDDGTVPMKSLDDAVARILTSMEKVGLLDGAGANRPTFDLATGASVAQQIAEEGGVLLKNGGTLPLSTGKTVALFGEGAIVPKTTGVLSAAVASPNATSPREAITARAGAAVVTESGTPETAPIPAAALTDPTGFPFDATGTNTAQSLTYSGTLNITDVGAYTFSIGMVGYSSASVTIDGTRVVTAQYSAGSGSITLSAGAHTFALAGYASVGSLTLSWITPTAVADAHQHISSVAAASDVAVVFVSDVIPGDRALSLPAEQNDLITTVADANPHTVVVLNASSAVTMPWLSKVDAVLDMYYPGVNGAEATTALLYGDVNPSGKLSQTFPVSEEKSLFYGNAEQYPGVNNVVSYSEGIDVGYRGYARHKIKPLFPFGYGLSYTTFKLSDVTAAQDGDTVKVTVKVENTGSRSGKEVVQVYAGPSVDSNADQPITKLVGFAKVEVAAGASQTVEIPVDPHQFEYWDTDAQAWKFAAGKRSLRVGNSATNSAAELTLNLVDPATIASDKTALQEAATAGQSLNPVDYAASTWAEYAAALTAAQQVLGSSTATVQQVADAKAALAAAQAALRADTTSLKLLADLTSGLKSDEYTPDSWAILSAARTTATAVLAQANPAVNDVKSAVTNLKSALDGLQAVKATAPKAPKVTTTSVKVSASAFKKASKPKITVSIKLSSGVAKGKIAVYV
ncbi:MAG: glycoside hydrolase family 3 C-terminal domain-containing protein, partial [Propionibacteriaceae bacterium]|nr:glycoside hydrolase family 3 C-terminal domain-containing protein [Propionibacteriaceae bacterium]